MSTERPPGSATGGPARRRRDQLAETIGKIEALLTETTVRMCLEYQAVCIDKFGVDGHKDRPTSRVTDKIVIPWASTGSASTL